MAKSCGAGILPAIIAYNYTKSCGAGILPAIIALIILNLVVRASCLL